MKLASNERRDVRHSTVVERRGVAPAEWKLFERVRIVVCVCEFVRNGIVDSILLMKLAVCEK